MWVIIVVVIIGKLASLLNFVLAPFFPLRGEEIFRIHVIEIRRSDWLKYL